MKNLWQYPQLFRLMNWNCTKADQQVHQQPDLEFWQNIGLAVTYYCAAICIAQRPPHFLHRQLSLFRFSIVALLFFRKPAFLSVPFIDKSYKKPCHQISPGGWNFIVVSVWKARLYCSWAYNEVLHLGALLAIKCISNFKGSYRFTPPSPQV